MNIKEKEYQKKYRQSEAYKESKKRFDEKHPGYYAKMAKEHYHKNKVEINERRRHRPSSIFHKIRMNAKSRKIPFLITTEIFEDWYNKQEKKCTYCELPIERLPLNEKGDKSAKTLSIDRKDNDKGYEIENIVLACMRCNFIKSNLLSFEEMKEIGIKYIKPKWL